MADCADWRHVYNIRNDVAVECLSCGLCVCYVLLCIEFTHSYLLQAVSVYIARSSDIYTVEVMCFYEVVAFITWESWQIIPNLITATVHSMVSFWIFIGDVIVQLFFFSRLNHLIRFYLLFCMLTNIKYLFSITHCNMQNKIIQVYLFFCEYTQQKYNQWDSI